MNRCEAITYEEGDKKEEGEHLRGVLRVCGCPSCALKKRTENQKSKKTEEQEDRTARRQKSKKTEEQEDRRARRWKSKKTEEQEDRRARREKSKKTEEQEDRRARRQKREKGKEQIVIPYVECVSESHVATAM